MKYLSYFLTLFMFCIDAQGSDDCSKVIPSGAVLFKQFSLGSELACIYEGASATGAAVLDFYSIDASVSKLIGSNIKLVSLEDARNGMNMPDITKVESGEYQVLWGHPNGVDVVNLKLEGGALYFSGATKELRPRSFGGDDKVTILTLINDSSMLPVIAFSNISLSDVLNKESFKLKAGKLDLKINVDKAFLYSYPAENSKTKNYLVKGDLIIVTEYKSGYLKASYKMKNGNYLNRWVSLTSVI